jgi:hypothetical protein
MTDEPLVMWTVYKHPADYPGWFVARPFAITSRGSIAGSQVLKARTLKAVRDMLPPGLTCLTRSPDDEPQIVETWV